ncbi:MAG: amidase [Pseudomonadota bacterium]|nr:amidase [Pseudomonadota bacterium]
MRSSTIRFRTLEEIARDIRLGRVSSLEVTRDALERGRSLNRQLGAFITFMEEQAIEDARRADRMIAQGDVRAASMPLLGVPVSVKDVFDTAGVRTTAGSRVFRRRKPARDALAVRRLREAGAVILGKTNLSEFAWGSVQSAFGALRNPHDPSRFAGGSSSGAGAALATGIGYGALGSDTAGSIRMPAAFCGVVGIKPTFGLVPCDGAIPLAWTMDTAGPLARTARDARIMLRALCDSASRRAIGAGRPDRTGGTRVLRGSLSGITIGIPEKHFFETLEPDVERALDEARRELRRAGARLRSVDLPFAELSNLATAIILQVEGATWHREKIARHFDAYGEIFRGRMIQGLLIPGRVYLKAQQLRNRIRLGVEAALGRVDAILTPTTAIVAHPLDETPRNSARVADIGRCTSPASLAGLPALSLPCGMSGEGLPIGMQLIGRAFEDGTLLRIGEAWQSRTDWHERRPEPLSRESS